MQEEKQYWQRVKTVQFMEGINHLEKLWRRGNSGMLIAPTGAGKSDLVKTFCQNKKITSFKVTASKSHRLIHILTELLAQMGDGLVEKRATEKSKVDAIINYLKSVTVNGKKPIIIIDESENLDISVLKTVKTFYDALVGICAIVLIGTPELTEKMLNKMSRHRGGIPQLYRRLKVGTKTLTPLNKYVHFPLFFEALKIDAVGLQKLLLEKADNYGELHDYLEPVLREADLTNTKLTEDFFRLYHDIPRTKTA